MDPEDAYTTLKSFSQRVAEGLRISQTDVDEAAEAFDALDGWLSHGGFPPSAWITTPAEPVNLCPGSALPGPMIGPGRVQCVACHEVVTGEHFPAVARAHPVNTRGVRG